MLQAFFKTTWQSLLKIRSERPLVYCFTNHVAMDLQANTLLCLGASPIMSFEQEELDELIQACGAVSINIGCIEAHQFGVVKSILDFANLYNKPVVFDPVGSGATKYRTQFCRDILDTKAKITFKGNGSEILSLFDNATNTKGVESNLSSQLVGERIKSNVISEETLFAVTGVKDFVLSRNEYYTITGGSSLMTKVTAMGCSLGGVIAAFQAVNPNKVEATVQALMTFKACGSVAADKAKHPGSFRSQFLDQLHDLTSQHLERSEVFES